MAKRRLIESLVAAGALGLAAAATPAGAATLFADDFNGDAAGSILNFNSFGNWDVINGTVDYIRSGGFGISCLGGSGGCVDLDGSTGNAGRMISKSSFALDPGTTYRLTITFSGNQRGGANDGIAWGLTDGSLDAPAAALAGIAPSAAFTTDFVQFSGVGGTLRLFVQDTNTGGDNVGPILDNVLFETVANGSTVPEPGSLALLATAVLGFGIARRKRTAERP